MKNSNKGYEPSLKAKMLYECYLTEKEYAEKYNKTNEDNAYILNEEDCEEVKIIYGKKIKGFVDQINVAIETYDEIKNEKEEELWYNTFNY